MTTWVKRQMLDNAAWDRATTHIVQDPKVQAAIATYTVNLSTEALNGAWKLRVQDVAAGDVGTLNSWSITF